MFFLPGAGQIFDNSVNETIDRIKKGDRELKNRLIDRYRPFIVKAVSRAAGNKFIDAENSEEYSIGLMAFDEAIDCYDETKNRNFFGFARQVIRRRIINYMAGKKKRINEYPFTYFQEDSPDFPDKIPDRSSDIMQSYETIEEIGLLRARLGEFGITFRDLVFCAPRHKDSKLLAIRVAGVISGSDDLFNQMMERKVLPVSGLMKKVKINKRTLERNRKFIIAVALILRSDLEILKEYIYAVERHGEWA
ncbi:MAG: RNA polymerase sigma-I factor [Bacillota bacterium]